MRSKATVLVAEPWCIYVDVEGFRWFLAQNKLQAVKSLGELMRSIFRLGRRCYPQPPKRLNAHQFGDGFLILGSHEDCLDRCVAIAVAVMRHVAASGCFARAAIAEGELADIQGCYPDEVTSCSEDSHRISLHMGLMTITSVMGSALTRSVGLAEEGKPASSGPLLITRKATSPRIDPSIPRRSIPKTPGLLSIDWVHMESELLAWLQRTADLNRPSSTDLEVALAQYCADNHVTPEWKSNVHNLLGVPVQGSASNSRGI